MSEHPARILEKLDPEFIKLVENISEFILTDGALSKKLKLLIAMALDASHRAVDGVKALVREAMEAGATKDEIMETLRVAQLVSGVGSIYGVAQALKELF
jgi:alkylhydroperoxidase/carboxymuconolactone decarboxylase family protein YurZ